MHLLREFDRRVGGSASRHVIVVFALTLGLVSADTASLGAVAPELKSSLNIDNGDLGLVAGSRPRRLDKRKPSTGRDQRTR
jgi:hypothetical protein